MTLVIDLLISPALWGVLSLLSLITYQRLRIKDKRTRIILLSLISAGFAYSTSESLKLMFRVHRPCYGLDYCPLSYSMPSTHSTVAFALFWVISSASNYLTLLLAVLVAIERVVTGVHTIADVSAGAVLGIVIAHALLWVNDDDKKSKKRNKTTRH